MNDELSNYISYLIVTLNLVEWVDCIKLCISTNSFFVLRANDLPLAGLNLKVHVYFVPVRLRSKFLTVLLNNILRLLLKVLFAQAFRKALEALLYEGVHRSRLGRPEEAVPREVELVLPEGGGPCDEVADVVVVPCGPREADLVLVRLVLELVELHVEADPLVAGGVRLVGLEDNVLAALVLEAVAVGIYFLHAKVKDDEDDG